MTANMNDECCRLSFMKFKLSSVSLSFRYLSFSLLLILFKKDHEKPNSEVIFSGSQDHFEKKPTQRAINEGQKLRGTILRAHQLYSNNFNWSNFFNYKVLQKFQHHYENF